MQYFRDQEKDDIGRGIAKFQKVLIGLFIISVLAFIFNIAEASYYGGYGFIWVPLLYWALLFCGFYGAHKRQAGLLLVWFIITIILICLIGIWLIVAFIALAAIADLCAGIAKGFCTYDIGAIIGLYVIAIVLNAMEFGVSIFALVLCHRIRPMITPQTTQVVVVQQQVQPGVVYAQPGVVYAQPQPGVVYAQQPGVVYAQPQPGYTTTVNV